MFVNKDTGGVKLWVVALVLGAVVVAFIVIKDVLTYDNLISTNANGTFVRKSYFKPMTAARKNEIAANLDKAAAEKAAADKK